VQDESLIQEADKAALRADLVPAMIALPTAADKLLRAQIAETISIIARSDFPGRWPDLIDVSSFCAQESPMLVVKNVSLTTILETGWPPFQ
jgi:hypothetical protein